MFPRFERHDHLYFLSSILSGIIFLPVSEPHFPSPHLLVLSSCVSRLSSECSGTFVYFMLSIFLTCLLSCREWTTGDYIPPKSSMKPLQWGHDFSILRSLSFFVCLSVHLSTCPFVCLSRILVRMHWFCLVLPQELLFLISASRDAEAQLFGHIVWPWFSLLPIASFQASSLFPESNSDSLLCVQ